MGLPQDPAEEAAERAAIEKEMAELRKINSAVKNPNKALAAERKRRWEESKKRRAENKKKRAEVQQQRREQYAAFRATTIVHVGAGVSGGLQDTNSDIEQLTERGLPIMQRRSGTGGIAGHQAERPVLVDVPPSWGDRGALSPFRDRQKDRRRASHLAARRRWPTPSAGFSTIFWRSWQ